MTESKNGNNLTFKWLAGILLSIVIAFGGWTIKSSLSSTAAIAQDAYSTRERVSSLEAKGEDISKRLDRIENKIDALLHK